MKYLDINLNLFPCERDAIMITLLGQQGAHFGRLASTLARHAFPLTDS